MGRRRSIIASLSSGVPEPPVLLSWEHVLWSIANNSYTTDYTVGDLIPLDLGTEGNINMQIVAFDADDKADGTGKAHITFMSKELLVTSHRMNPEQTRSSAPYKEGTGTIGGWEKSEMRTYLKNTIKPKIPTDVRNSIVDVTKYTYIYNADGTVTNNSATTDDLWVPSFRELSGATYETIGAAGYRLTKGKIKVNGSLKINWWTRTAANSSDFHRVTDTGGFGQSNAKNALGIALGFCL